MGYEEINGKIKDDITKLPIPFVVINILDFDISTSSDSLGEFTFTNKIFKIII